MELDFKKCDIVDSKEDEIEKIVYLQNPKNANIVGVAQQIGNNKDIVMFSTLMSILFKARSKLKYMQGKSDVSYEENHISILMTEEIMWNLYKKQKNPKQIKEFILENGCIIEELLLKYYSEKNINYVTNRFFIDTVINQSTPSEILKLNPYMINQLLDYQQNPLTYEEKIIEEMLDYYSEAQELYESPIDINYTIGLLKNNNELFESKKKLLYIVSNVYQQSGERKDKTYYYKLSQILEMTQYKPQNIIRYLNNNTKIRDEIVGKFIDYNIYIEEDTLEKLEQKPSAVYAKKIYHK